MIQLGKQQELQVLRTTSIGVYLGEAADPLAVFARKTTKNTASMTEVQDLLLPKNEIKTPLNVGDRVRVFVYKDSEDRPIATLKFPSLQVGTLTELNVKMVTDIGAFLDWGLPKDLFLPFHEQTVKVREGDRVLVTLYVDKSKRLCATMKLYKHLRTDSPYFKDNWVRGMVYEINEAGAYVAVDNTFSGMIPAKELTGHIKVGDQVKVRVVNILKDGKLELSPREHSYLQIDDDCQLILKRLEAEGGFLPYHDKTDAAVLKEQFNMSKNAFKRAIGHLYREGLIVLEDNGIRSKTVK